MKVGGATKVHPQHPHIQCPRTGESVWTSDHLPLEYKTLEFIDMVPALIYIAASTILWRNCAWTAKRVLVWSGTDLRGEKAWHIVSVISSKSFERLRSELLAVHDHGNKHFYGTHIVHRSIIMLKHVWVWGNIGFKGKLSG